MERPKVPATVLLKATEQDVLYTAWGSIVHNQNQDPSFRIATAPRSDPQILAAAAETRGIDDIFWTTDLDLFNPGDSAAAIEISVSPTSGFQSPSTRMPITVPTRSTRTLLVCTNCGGEMHIVSVILEHRVIRRILCHLVGNGVEAGRGPHQGFTAAV